MVMMVQTVSLGFGMYALLRMHVIEEGAYSLPLLWSRRARRRGNRGRKRHMGIITMHCQINIKPETSEIKVKLHLQCYRACTVKFQLQKILYVYWYCAKQSAKIFKCSLITGTLKLIRIMQRVGIHCSSKIEYIGNAVKTLHFIHVCSALA